MSLKDCKRLIWNTEEEVSENAFQCLQPNEKYRMLNYDFFFMWKNPQMIFKLLCIPISTNYLEESTFDISYVRLI